MDLVILLLQVNKKPT